MTHRAVMTARGKEFPLTGYLAISQTGGMRLIISQMFGSPVADVLVKADGSVHVMRNSAMLKRKWIERNVAADLKCLFSRAATQCPVEEIDPKHLILQRRWYKIDLRIVDIKAGPQRAELFDESQASEQ